MSVKIVLPEGDGPKVSQGTKVYTASGEEVPGVVAIDIRVRPNECITANMEIMVHEIDNLEGILGHVVLIDPAEGCGEHGFLKRLLASFRSLFR